MSASKRRNNKHTKNVVNPKNSGNVHTALARLLHVKLRFCGAHLSLILKYKIKNYLTLSSSHLHQVFVQSHTYILYSDF